MTTAEVTLRQEITRRKKLKEDREKSQLKLVPDEAVFHEKIRAKLSGLLETSQFANFARCGKEEIYRTCKSCGDVHRFLYKCSLKWCPLCNWQITRRRAELIRAWQPRVAHPMHLVLTQRNFATLTGARLRSHTRALAKLRRADVMRHVKGGCVSVEVTHEGRGWHLHSHWLIDATFVSMKKLAIVWGKLIGQEFGIVHYNQLSNSSYCNEVCKYVVKGSEMSDWPPELINEFCQAIRGRRFFFTFGSLFKEQRSVRLELLASKPPPAICECGASDFVFRSELAELLAEIRRESR